MSTSTFAPIYLVACALTFTIVYGLPLAIAPLVWARRFGWRIWPDPLTIYFGRCLGCVIIAVSVAAVRVSYLPAARDVVLELLAVAFGAMIVVHVVGWLRKAQPAFETLELPGFVVLTAVALWLRFG